MKKIALLGSTGSIGCNVLEVIRQFPEQYKLVSLAAGRNIRRCAEQVLEFSPELISVAEEDGAAQLRSALPESYKDRIVFGVDGACQVASCDSADMTISSMVGAAGLLPTTQNSAAGTFFLTSGQI